MRRRRRRALFWIEAFFVDRETEEDGEALQRFADRPRQLMGGSEARKVGDLSSVIWAFMTYRAAEALLRRLLAHEAVEHVEMSRG